MNPFHIKGNFRRPPLIGDRITRAPALVDLLERDWIGQAELHVKFVQIAAVEISAAGADKAWILVSVDNSDRLPGAVAGNGPIAESDLINAIGFAHRGGRKHP